MHIKNPQSALLSNHEVYKHIQAESKYYLTPENSRVQSLSGVKEILQDGLRYFEGDASAPTIPDVKKWINPAKALSDTHPTRPMTLYKGPNSLLRALAPKYRLNKTEYLQIYNLRPQMRVTLDLIIEEASTRFKDEEMEDILDIIIRIFEEEEEDIREGVEFEEMERLPEEMLGVTKKKRKQKRKA